MGGGLMQLVAYGAQDIYLTGNPQITFFKIVYRRHTNFAIESKEQTFSGKSTLGTKFTCNIARNGDLLSRIYLAMNITSSDVNKSVLGKRIGHKLIDFVDVEIGGQTIDKQYGEWLELWAQLSHGDGSFTKLDKMVSGLQVVAATNAKKQKIKCYVPLQFWFCRNPGLALPLIALQYHEVKINVSLKSLEELGNSGIQNFGTLDEVEVWCDYIFLDTDERRRFAQVSHEYLIEQIQFSNSLMSASGKNQRELRFNHPVKELIWVCQPKDNTGFNYFSTNGSNGVDNVKTALIQLNGHDRFTEREGHYFRCVQTYQHHSGGHRQNPGQEEGGFYVYSFALKPEEHQPSGTCNFSRIDNAVLNYTAVSEGKFRAYAINYNVLRIMSGMGGLAYSN